MTLEELNAVWRLSRLKFPPVGTEFTTQIRAYTEPCVVVEIRGVLIFCRCLGDFYPTTMYFSPEDIIEITKLPPYCPSFDQWPLVYKETW